MTQKKLHVKKDDMVKIIAGKDRGKTGKVLKALPKDERVIVEGVSMMKKHQRPSQTNPQGGILEIEAPIHVSNVMLVCPNCNEPSRVGAKILDDGSKVRYCKTCEKNIDR